MTAFLVTIFPMLLDWLKQFIKLSEYSKINLHNKIVHNLVAVQINAEFQVSPQDLRIILNSSEQFTLSAT